MENNTNTVTETDKNTNIVTETDKNTITLRNHTDLSIYNAI